MKTKSIICTLLLCACAEVTSDATRSGDEIIENEDKVVTEETESTDTQNGADDENTDTNTDDEPEIDLDEEGNSDLNVVSGIWGVDSASLIEDTCDWDTQLRTFFGVGSDGLLPQDFTVEGYVGSFEIEANSYGASGPILCVLNNTAFACEQQSVTPVDYDLGSMGWTYAIDFLGNLNDERSLTGTAKVSFPTVSEFLAPVFDALGVDISQCTQTFSLSLSVAE